MSMFPLRRRAIMSALFASLGTAAAAQTSRRRAFASVDEAASAFIEAIRKNDEKALEDMLGSSWLVFVPAAADDLDGHRAQFLSAWDAGHKIVAASDDTARIEVGTSGFTLPLPLARGPDGWRFDVVAGRREVAARQIGRNELTIVQTLLAIVDAQHEYAMLDPTKSGMTVYARRFLSNTGRKDGLYWPTEPGEPSSPIGALVADAQPDDAKKRNFYGYHFRMLTGQGGDAPGGELSYLVANRMLGGFAVIAWPVRYGETGVSTFMVNYKGDVFEQDFGPDTPKAAVAIRLFDPG